MIMKYAIVALVFILMILAGLSYTYNPLDGDGAVTEDKGISSFRSAQEFKAYLQESAAQAGLGYYGSSFASVGQARTMEAVPTMADEGLAAPTAGKAAGEAARVSETTVQVMGIDEPDIVKTDGSKIYFSSYGYGGSRSWSVPYYSRGETKVIDAFPPEGMSEGAKIDKMGNLLLHDDVLVIFSGDKIYGYDVSDPESPVETWEIELNGSIVGARLYNDKIYLITRTYINQYNPCPVVPLTRNGVSLTIACPRVYHPVNNIQADVTFNAMILIPGSGEVEKAVSFVGSSGSTELYMSTNAIYLAYGYQGDMVEIFSGFFKENPDLFPSDLIARIDKLKDYDISAQSKMMELGLILQNYMSSLSSDESLRIQNEMTNRMEDYSAKHIRDFTRTGIAKIGLDLEMEASGSVPGTLLNQFSLDEYEDHLRVAVTVSGTWQFRSESANDVYVLDSDLNTVGSVLDLGLTERIYSVRFIQDKGYVVTFRQVDPFYVLDMSSPTNPQLKGELKIPGYSSYLHPITKDKILGIGKEGSQVKISLFDVSDPENPAEADKYMLSEYWSDVLNTHHAFLLDDKHEVFFLPGSKGGYVFSYADDELSLVKAVSDISARRAIYIDDYMYVIGDDEIVVLDENTWEKVNELELSSTSPSYPKPMPEAIAIE
jgi:uncharacterized secreted protein with C-terminal beta-propeller domain